MGASCCTPEGALPRAGVNSFSIRSVAPGRRQSYQVTCQLRGRRPLLAQALQKRWPTDVVAPGADDQRRCVPSFSLPILRGGLVQQLDGVRMPRLVWRESAPDHARPRVGPSITQNSGPGGSAVRSAVQLFKLSDSCRPARRVRSSPSRPVSLTDPSQNRCSAFSTRSRGDCHENCSPATSVLEEVTSWPGISTRTTSRGAAAIVFEGHKLAMFT